MFLIVYDKFYFKQLITVVYDVKFVSENDCSIFIRVAL